MGKKSKKPPPEIKPQYVLPPNQPQNPPRKKKKNAPDKPQPEWMFPPDESNPVLNPKPKSEQKRLQEERDRDGAIKFLQYKSVTTPMKACPPDLLLTLVGAFLSSYGFNSASRLYTTQLESRKKLDEWKFQLDAKLPKGFPDLVKIFKEWFKEYQERTKLDETSSSSGSDDYSDSKISKKLKKAKRTAAVTRAKAKDETSSSGDSESSSGESNSDVEMKDSLPALKDGVKTTKSAKAKLSSASKSSSSSDSNADDEKERAGVQLSAVAHSQKPTANGLVNKLKRKPSSHSDFGPSPPVPPPKRARNKMTKSKETSSSDTSSSDSDSGAEVSAPAATTSRSASTSSKTSSDSGLADDTAKSDPITLEPAKRASTSSSDTSSSSPDSEDDVDFSKPPAPTPLNTTANQRPSSDSSETLQASSVQKSPLKQSNELKKQNTPFQRVPRDTLVDPKMSNKYKPYEYANKAHADLSVVRGKGFTKEKNKKKRGSYRGGVIDVSGGKGVKFED
ncbi:hypothetical protein MMC21_006401 [Puttea exsequens]|nr:hypothetical protein [Puttea exsequens]